jgi:hypothetical protein
MREFMHALPKSDGTRFQHARARVTTWSKRAILLNGLAEPPFQSGEK